MHIHELFEADDITPYIDLARIPPDLLWYLRRSLARQTGPIRTAELIQALYGHEDADRRERLELDLLSVEAQLRRAKIDTTLADAVETWVKVLNYLDNGHD